MQNVDKAESEWQNARCASSSILNSAFCILNCLALSLLVLGVGADHAHDVLAADDLAVLTDAADAAADFHGFLNSKGKMQSSKLKTVTIASSILHFAF
jgi:hypothetical protein